jgi:hypothetical protein
VSYPHGLNSGSTVDQVNPLNQMNDQREDFSPACDPVFTYNLLGDAECNFSVSSGVTCPVMGTLLNTDSSGTASQLIVVYTKIQYVTATGDSQDGPPKDA